MGEKDYEKRRREEERECRKEESLSCMRYDYNEVKERKEMEWNGMKRLVTQK